MKLSLSEQALSQYLSRQMAYFFPDEQILTDDLDSILPQVIERMNYCFSHIHKKYYQEHGQVLFNHLNSDHYAMFLYWISNQAFHSDLISLAEKAFLLNKALHGIDAFYSVELPKIFLWVHPVGTVLGHASYSDYLVVYQNVTVGSDLEGIYPTFDSSCVLYAKSTVLGQCQIGSNVIIAAHALIRNTTIPDNSMACGLYPHQLTKPNLRQNQHDFFHVHSLR